MISLEIHAEPYRDSDKSLRSHELHTELVTCSRPEDVSTVLYDALCTRIKQLEQERNVNDGLYKYVASNTKIQAIANSSGQITGYFVTYELLSVV